MDASIERHVHRVGETIDKVSSNETSLLSLCAVNSIDRAADFLIEVGPRAPLAGSETKLPNGIETQMVIRLRLAANPTFVVMSERLTNTYATAYVDNGFAQNTGRGADVLVLARESEHVCRDCRRERFLARSSFVITSDDNRLPYPVGKNSYYHGLHNVHMLDTLSSDLVASRGAT